MKSVRFVKRQMNEWKPDVVLSFMNKSNVISLSAQILSGADTPVVVAERANPHHTSAYMKVMRRVLYPRAAGAVFQTEQAQAYYRGILTCDPVVLRNPLNPDFDIEPFEGERRKTIVTMGRLSAEKNQKLLIDAFSRIANRYPDHTVEIYGEGPLHQQLKSHIDELGLSGRVRLMGRKDNIQQHIRDAGIFVLPSNSEGMPNALLEAMAMGIPSIATDCPIGGPAFILQDRKNGILLPMNDADKLAAALTELIENKELAQRLSESGRRVLEDFAAVKVCAEWEAYLEKVAGQEN